MKFLLSVVVVTLTLTAGLSQSSSVTISSLKVMDIIDPSVHELNSFFIDFSASDAKSLSRIEISLEDNINRQMIIIPVSVKDKVAQLDFEKFSQPLSSNNIQFMQKVRNQFKEPYKRIVVKAYDQAGKETNQLVFERLK